MKFEKVNAFSSSSPPSPPAKNSTELVIWFVASTDVAYLWYGSQDVPGWKEWVVGESIAEIIDESAITVIGTM